MDTSTYLDAPFERPPTGLILRRGWFDPWLYLVAVALTFLIYVTIDGDRNADLETQIGYSGTRLAVISALVMFVWGTIQGLRGKMVVYIDDELTPGYQDAVRTFAIVLVPPLTAFVAWFLVSLGSDLLFPATIRPPKYDNAALVLACVMWAAGGVWLFARLYAYNRNALAALTAFVAKLGWCVFAIFYLERMHRDVANDDNFSMGEAAGNFFAHLILFIVALVVIEKLTYCGPSLRR